MTEENIITQDDVYPFADSIPLPEESPIDYLVCTEPGQQIQFPTVEEINKLKESDKEFIVNGLTMDNTCSNEETLY